MKGKIELLKLIWEVAKTVGPKMQRYFSQWFRRKIRAEREEFKNLERLVKTLGKVQLWLGYSQSEMIEKIQNHLNKIQWSIWTEALPYIAIYSKNEKDRCLALRNLSQVEGKGSIECAIDTINGIARNKNTTKRVKRVAKVALKELKKRQEMKTQ